MEVQPVICSEMEINQLISSMYGMQSESGRYQWKNMEIESKDKEDSETQEEIQITSLQDQAGEALVVRLD